MSLGDDVREALYDLRAQALTLMADVGRIERAGAPVLDLTTGVSAGTRTTVHEGQCRLKMPTAAESERVFGDEQFTATRFLAIFPHDVYGVHIDDTLRLLSTADGDAAGFEYRILTIPAGTDLVVKAFGCEAVA